MNKKMKSLFLLVLLIFVLAACKSEDDKTGDKKEDTVINIMTLKGPTSMGLVSLMDKENASYNFNIVTAADEISAKMVKGDVDIATVPANLASILYSKTDKGITVLNINTLGVLYIVTKDEGIKELKDLEGKTLYLTGKGTTPEFALNFLLDAYDVDIDKINLEFKSESSEVAAVLASDENAIGLLPQPFVTVAMTSNTDLKMAIDLSKIWEDLGVDSSLVTGVTVVRNEFLSAHKDLVNKFLDDSKISVEFAQKNVDETAVLVDKFDIVKEAVAKKAIPYCNITFIEGTEMKTKLSAYLGTLYEQNPQSIGGELPDENFYYNR